MSKGPLIYVFPVDGLQECIVPINDIDPFRYPNIMFTRNGVSIGVLDYFVVYNMKGYVNLAFLGSQLPLQVEQPAERHKEALIEQPPLFTTLALFNSIPTNIRKVSLIEFQKRVDWIIGAPRVTEPEYDVITMTWCSTLGMAMRRCIPALDIRERLFTIKLLTMVDKIATSFETKRNILEHNTFNRLVEPFLQRGHEKALLRLLIAHGIPPDELFKEYIVDGTPQDSRTTIRRHLYRPEIYVRVKAVNVPHNVLLELPLQPGGYVHLHPSDVGKWLWKRAQLMVRKLNDDIWTRPRDKIPLQLLDIAKQAYTKLLHMKNIPINHTISHTKQFATRTVTEQNDKLHGVTIRHLPACLRFDRWVKNEQRKQIAFNMRKAGCDIEDCANIVHYYNTLETPGATREDTDKKWYIQSLYTGEFTPQGCARLMANNKESGHIIRCPYQDKTSCVEDLKKRNDNNVPPWAKPSNLWGPYIYIKWSHQGEAYAAAQKRKHIDIEMEESDSSSGDEPFDYYEEEGY